jgi:hypothetical protein
MKLLKRTPTQRIMMTRFLKDLRIQKDIIEIIKSAIENNNPTSPNIAPERIAALEQKWYTLELGAETYISDMPKYVSDSAMSKPSFGIIFNLPKSQTRN